MVRRMDSPWLLGRKVLGSPYVAQIPLWDEEILPAALTKEQVQQNADSDLAPEGPLDRHYETCYLDYNEQPHFWV